MSTVERKDINFKINGKEVTAKEGTVILDVAKRNDIPITNLCSHRNLKPFAACRTCMVEVNVDGKKELVYSCTHPPEDGMEVYTNTDETNRYNSACLEMLLVEHPLDCPICDKSGVCPLQDNTDALGIFDGRFEINRRNEPSIKTNPIIEFYLNRCIMCGMCVRACDEIQGVQALDFHKRGMSVTIGTANEEPLDCEFCGQCITVCPTGALMDMTSEARGLAALFAKTESTCDYCSWGCSVRLEAKKGKVVRIEPIDDEKVGINNGNLCAKGRLGHGIIHNDERIQSPMMNVGGNFKEVSWEEAIEAIAERMQTTVNRNGAGTVAGIGGEKLTNEESYLFQKLFRAGLGSNQITTLQNLRAPYINSFMLKCFENGIHSKPIMEMEEADVALVFNSDLPSEYPVGGNAIRKAAINFGADIIIANPRNVIFNSETKNDIRLQFSAGSDLVVANRLTRILIDSNIVDVDKLKKAVPNYSQMTKSLSKYTAKFAEKATGINDDVFTQAAESFGKKADRFVLIGNDILENGQGQEILDALLNLAIVVHHGGEGSVSIYPPREHANSQGAIDMGVAPQFLPGYKGTDDQTALTSLANAWGVESLSFEGENLAEALLENCRNGSLKFLYIAGENPVNSYYKGSLVREALKTVSFLVVQDLYMTETAEMADIVLPVSSFAEKDGTFTNITRHVLPVNHAVIPEGNSKPDYDVFCEIAEALGKPFSNTDLADVQNEIEQVIPLYKGLMPGDKYGQWPADSFAENPEFALASEFKETSDKKDFPFKLISNNHMFHSGSHSQRSSALKEIGPECRAGIHPEDAKKLKLQSGDTIQVQSENHKFNVPVEVSFVSTQGTVYIPKNWTEIPVNMLRNGEEGLVSVKISKAG